MATTNIIATVIESVEPAYKVIGIRRPIVFLCAPLAPILALLMWWFLG